MRFLDGIECPVSSHRVVPLAGIRHFLRRFRPSGIGQWGRLRQGVNDILRRVPLAIAKGVFGAERLAEPS